MNQEKNTSDFDSYEIDQHINPYQAQNEKSIQPYSSETFQINLEGNYLLGNKRKLNQGSLDVEEENINNKITKTHNFFTNSSLNNIINTQPINSLIIPQNI